MDDNKRSKDGTCIPLPDNQQTNTISTPKTPAKRIAFMGGNADFRAARMRCALACEECNKLKEDAAVEDRTKAWLKLVHPASSQFRRLPRLTYISFDLESLTRTRRRTSVPSPWSTSQPSLKAVPHQQTTTLHPSLPTP